MTTPIDEYDSVVITHGGCADGVASAHMFELFAESAGAESVGGGHVGAASSGAESAGATSTVKSQLGKVRIYHSYNRDFSKNRDMPSLKGKKVFITDYSFPISVLKEIAHEANHIYIWDHHETSLKDLFVPMVSNVGGNGKDLFVPMVSNGKESFVPMVSNDLLAVDFTVLFTENGSYVDSSALTVKGYMNMMAQGFEVLRDSTDSSSPAGPSCPAVSTVSSERTTHIQQPRDTQRSTIIKSTGEVVVHTCRVSIVCDLSSCGAEIAYVELSKLLTAAVYPPWYLRHIRDRDLWLWDRPGFIAGVHYNENSRAFGEAFFEAQIRTTTLQAFDSYTPEQIEKLYTRGRELMEHNARFVKSVVSKAERVIFETYPARVATCSVLQSEIGNVIVTPSAGKPGTTLPKYQFIPLIGIVVRYNIADKCWNISLRGREGSPNLAEIAKKYGGGGHPRAAGFDYVGNISDIFTLA